MSVFNPPDWRDASAYPLTADDLSLSQWAWEFLRRNPEYQNDYGYCAQSPDFGRKYTRHQLADASDDTKFRYCKYQALAGETVGEYFNRTGDETPFDYSVEDQLIDEKWEILYLADPANDDGYNCIPHLIDLPREIQQDFSNPSNNKGYIPTRTGWEEVEIESKPIEPEPEDWFEMTLRFDLRYSLDKQLDNAKILLQERVSILDYLQPDYPYHEWEKKRGAIGIQIRNLPMYLRAYDGRKAGDKFDQIGEELYRNEIENPDPDLALDQKNAEKRARDAYKNAIKLIEGGYKELMK
ncbi:MAG: DUF2285 domain-containing protein [Gammaproteobacteria bacterium]|nr:MAG: DUF2285 domain-containing protein [Gammaproteobacteria bacterium]